MVKIQEAAKQSYLQQQQGLYTMYLPYGYAAAPTAAAVGGLPPYPGIQLSHQQQQQHGMMPQPMGMMAGQQQPMGMPATGQQPMGMPGAGQQPMGMPGAGQQQPMGMVAAGQQPMGFQTPVTDGSGAPAATNFNPVYAQHPQQQAMYYPGMMGAPLAVSTGAPYNMQGLVAALPQPTEQQQQPQQHMQQQQQAQQLMPQQPAQLQQQPQQPAQLQQLQQATGREDTTLISFD